ncbi:DNA-binding transcriptional LysR family regulator [Barrientosiimonas humi]|uniref:DNA-binding transcriptional LysR family regulator n=1 Tax=Barrientosiimonas humi TaxID=999931 RepID=A0A542XB70_9MICO|nr:DNA-binding transcriptional LysR family regulator [Barrientosiimonas humi]CAG7573082.1 HTH-type transcriptional regulator GltC [Barrientosiimonas humi]
MDLRQLEYFLAVAEELSFTRAAHRLHVVQSGVSASIKSLERDVGAPLLDRSSKHVRLTDAGARLVPQAYAVLEAAQRARDAVAADDGELSGTVRLGTMTSVRLLDVPAILGEYHRRHPRVQLLMTAAPTGSRGLVTALQERRLDLAFVATRTGPPGIRFVPIAESELRLVVPEDDELVRRSRVGLPDLAGRSFIDAPEGYGTRAVIDAAFAEAGVGRRVTLEINDLGTGFDYVRHGLGIALLPDYLMPTSDLTGVAVLRMDDVADLTWPVALAARADRAPSAAAAALEELVREMTVAGNPGAG